MKRRVGFIGLGDQGAPIAAALAEYHDLRVWARRDASYAALGAVAFQRMPHPQALARSVDVLCLCLPGDAELKALLFTNTVAKELPIGAVVINHGTGDPGAAAQIADGIGQMGIGYLDAPVSGGHPGAVERTLTCFVGGMEATLEACRSVIECYSRTIILMGGPGSGQMTKLINNILTVSNMRNIVEVLTLAKSAGVDLHALQGALAQSSGGSFILQAIGRQIIPEIAEHIAGLNRKDVREFDEAMGARGLDAHVIVEWAMAGPDGLPMLVEAITEGREGSP